MALSYFNQVIGGVSQLWVTDGTALGTHIVAPLGINTIFNLTTIGSRVFFSLFDPAHYGQELWTSDGTAADGQGHQSWRGRLFSWRPDEL